MALTSTSVLPKLYKGMLDGGDVEVLATKVSVSVGRFDLEDTALQFEDGNIKGSATQVVNSHNIFTRFVCAVSKSSSSGLINDRGHIKTSDLSGILGCLPLNVVEVGWGGNNGMFDEQGENEYVLTVEMDNTVLEGSRESNCAVG